MPASDDRRSRPRLDEPAALQLPPTVMTEFDEGLDIDAETVAVGLPPPPSLGQPPTDPIHRDRAESSRSTDRPSAPGPSFSGAVAPAPIGRTAGDVRALDARRLAQARYAVFGLIGVSLTLGVVVILAHLFQPAGDIDSPIVVVTSPATPTRLEASARPSGEVAEFDRSADLAELEQLAAQRLGHGDRAGAAAVYRTLAERAPHERAFVAAARILSEANR